MQIINNAETAWEKLRIFGLHGKRSFLGFNIYSGKNGCVTKIDPATGMRVMLIPALIPRTERASKADKLKGKVGRPAKIGCVMFRQPQKRGRKAFIGPREQLVYVNHPQQKRGRKPMSEEMKAQKAIERAAMVQSGNQPAKKRGRKSEADRLKEAKAGDIVQGKGGYWTMLACGIATWTSQAA